MNDVNDITLYILGFVDFNVVKQKELTIVCKQWKVLLETRITNYDFERPGRLSIDTIWLHRDKFDWSGISYDLTLSESFIEKFQYMVELDCISKYQTLSEDFIERFQDSVLWEYISCGQKLSEQFIEKFQDRVVWEDISRRQKLSADFIEKFKDKVNWRNIYYAQKLSDDFKTKYASRLG